MRLSTVVSTLGILAATALPTTASTAPAFPIVMPVNYCIGDCLDMRVTVQSDGSFEDSDGDGGFWEINKPTREFRLTYEYDRDAVGIVFFGEFARGCFTGVVFDDRGDEVGDWESCL